MILKGQIDHDAKELRRMLIEYPDLPLVVFAGEDANCGDYSYMCCTSLSVQRSLVLLLDNDAPQPPNDEIIYEDEEELEDDLEELIFDEMMDASEEEREKELKKRMAMFEPYWKECIVLYANN